LASWLAAQHLSRVIDASSVNSTEAILEEERLIEHRTGPEPAIAFFDLTGFTTFAERRGDEAAAAMALRLADVAREISTRHGGRVVKLLGDGVLLRFADSASAVRALLDLLEAAEENGLPPGHAGIHQGPVITRNGDVFGRTVNLAARVGDAAPSGRLHVTAAVAAALDGLDGAAYDVAAAGTEALQGIGFVETFRVTRAR
jgi:class 3 adenylate cyclase